MLPNNIPLEDLDLDFENDDGALLENSDEDPDYSGSEDGLSEAEYLDNLDEGYAIHLN